MGYIRGVTKLNKNMVMDAARDFGDKLDAIKADNVNQAREAAWDARIAAIPTSVRGNNVDMPNPTWAEMRNVKSLGLTVEDYDALKAGEVERVDTLVESFGLEAVKKMVEIGQKIKKGETNWKMGIK